MSVRHFIARSLSIQIALVMAGALLIASAINFAILMGERYRAGINEQSGPAIGRFLVNAADVVASPPPDTGPMSGGRPQGGGRYMLMRVNPIDQRGLKRDASLEQRLRRALEEASIEVSDIRASTRIVERQERQERGRQADLREAPVNRRPGDGQGGIGPLNGPGFLGQVGPGPGRGGLRGDGAPSAGFAGPGPVREAREIVLAAQLADGRWFSGSNFSPQPPGDEVVRLAASTFITFAFVLGAALWVAGRLSRPLSDLQRAAARVGAASNPEEVSVRGPGDVRQTLEAFNAMSRRVSQLLSEKDVMLGALGHDLRTPLASLRIRIETMEPETERIKAVRTIEEASQLLEDILELARQGKSSETVRTMDLAHLVEDIVEDYIETGAPVRLASSEKTPAAVRPVLFRRALRNLIDNAIVYGERARLSVKKLGAEILVEIEDDGPGMSEEVLKSATDPFYRGDASRNRGTGGVGLGLTLANAIAKAHGGSLELANRAPSGLVARIRLPLAQLPPAS